MDRLDERILKAYQNTVLERKFDLGSGTMGNGVVVWNRAKEVQGDYEKIAHIDRNRKIKYYINNPPKQVKDYVEKIAKGSNPNISATQSGKVFKEDLDENLDPKDFKAYKGIVMRLLFANFKKFGDMKKAKAETFDALEKQSKLALNAFIKTALALKDDLDLGPIGPLPDVYDPDPIPVNLNEAEEVKFEDFDSNKQKFITQLVGKNRIGKQQYFSGIHGTIVMFHDTMGDVMRFPIKDFKKIASNKDVRWVDVRSIGMGYNKE